MALTPDEHARAALGQTSPAIKLMLERELMTVFAALMDAQDVALIHRLQGRARCISDFLNLIEQAEGRGVARPPASHTVR